MHSKAFLMRVRNETGSVARMVVRKNSKPTKYEAGRVLNVYRKTVEIAHFVATVSIGIKGVNPG